MIQMTWPGAPTLYYGDEAVCAAGPIRTAEELIHGEEKTYYEPLYGFQIHKRLPALYGAGNQQIAYGRMWDRYQTVTVISTHTTVSDGS